MRLLALSLMMTLTGVQATPQANQGVITGRVTRLGGSQGVAGVEVALMGPYVGTAMNAVISNPLMAAEIAEAVSLPQIPATTDSDGRFKFTGLAPGLYTGLAQREGYFGSAIPGGAATSRLVTLSATVVAGQPTPEVLVSMVRGAMFSGQVRDPNGQPVSGLSVAAYRLTYRDGRAGLASVISKTTDDRGEYRIFWLTPGEYYVAVTPPRPDTVARSQDKYARTFYPRATDARSASRLLLTDGSELTGTDIAIQATAVKVTGQVITTLPGPASQPLAPGPTLYLVPQDSNVLVEAAVSPITNLVGNRAAGKFELRGVSPGLYDLIATLPDSRGRQNPGRTRIAVGAQDLENVTVVIRPGVEVRVQVTLDGAAIAAATQPPATAQGTSLVPGGTLRFSSDGSLSSFSVVSGLAAAPAAPNMRVAIQPREGNTFDFTAPVTVNGDSSGAFVFSNVPEARYTIQVTGLPANAYVADIREGGTSVYDGGFQVLDRPPASLEVTVRSAGSTIRGTVRDANQKVVVTANVVLVPQMARRQNAALFKTALSGRDGTFTLTAIPPGEYKLFAWFNVPPTAYLNPEFLSKYESRGQPVSVLANAASLDVPLTAIPDEPVR